MTLHLYEIGDAYQQLRALAEEGGDKESWAQALVDLRDEAQPKLLSLARLIREQQAIQKTLADELGRLGRRQQLASLAEERLKRYIRTSMEDLELNKVSDSLLSVTLQANSGPNTEIVDPAAIPPAFVIGSLRLPLPQWPAELLNQVRTEFNRDAMIDAYRRGEQVPGVEFSVGQHIRIR